jgi:signal transduction histidine kinase
LFRSYRTRLQFVFLSLGLAAITLTGWEASAGAEAALRQATYDRLTAIRQSCVRDIERYFQDLSSHVLALSSDESIIRAVEDLGAAWTSIAEARVDGAEEQLLRAYYREHKLDAPGWFPSSDRRTVELQHIFLSGNPNPFGSKDRLLDPPGVYGKVHARYHPTLHRYQNAFGFYDVFLIDATSGRVLYTVFKESDLGIRLDAPPYSESPLGDIYRRASQLTEPEQLVISDFRPYVPSHSAPAAFAAAPIWRAGAKIGVLAIQVSIRELNRVMTADGNWQAEGLGRTGQAYIVGPDNKLRSDMRLRIEQPDRFYAELLRAGTPQEDADEVRQHGTAILRMSVAPEAARYRTSPAGTEIGVDTFGVQVLRSHAPVNLPGIEWAAMVEIEAEEAFAPVDALRKRILGYGSIIAVGFWIAAAWMARSVTRPVLAVAARAKELGERKLQVAGPPIPVESADEIGQLAEAFNRMVRDLDRTTVSKDELQKLAGRLITAQEDERRRLARELHDDMTQRLAAVAIDAGNLERLGPPDRIRSGLERIRQQMARLSEDIHGLSRSLHPAMLDELGLVAAIESETRAFFERGGPPVEFQHSEIPANLSPEARLALYRITQEALRNIQKHASTAESIAITLEASDEEIHLQVADNGPGFNRTDPLWRPGVGLASMEERVRLLDGRLSIESHGSDSGTKIDVWLPISNKPGVS